MAPGGLASEVAHGFDPAELRETRLAFLLERVAYDTAQHSVFAPISDDVGEPLVQAARVYRAIGLQIGPPLERFQKFSYRAPRRVLDDATFAEWEAEWFQGRGVAVYQGPASQGFCTLDVDSDDAIAELRNILGDEALDTWTVCTPRGWHFHYWHNGPLPPATIAGLFGLNVELLGNSSAVPMPPTRLAPGQVYRALADPREAGMKRLPMAVLSEANRCQRERKTPARTSNSTRNGRRAGPSQTKRPSSWIHDSEGRVVVGHRHEALMSIGSTLNRLRYVSPQMFRNLLTAVNEGYFEKPLTKKEAAGIVSWFQSGGRGGFTIKANKIPDEDAAVLARLRSVPGGEAIIGLAAEAYGCEARTVQRTIKRAVQNLERSSE